MKYVKIAMLVSYSVINVPGMVAKNTLPSLKRLKKKVEQALEEGTSQTFKDLLQKAGNASSLLTGTAGHTTVVSQDGVPLEKEQLDELTKKLTTLFWAHLQEFSTQLKQVAAQSKEQALQLFTDMIIQRCGQQKILFKAFIHELEQEDSYLQYAQTTLQAMGTTRRSVEALKESFQQKIQQELVNVSQLKQNLDELLTVVDQLLIGR